jgi:hypothetical protein
MSRTDNGHTAALIVIDTLNRQSMRSWEPPYQLFAFCLL